MGTGLAAGAAWSVSREPAEIALGRLIYSEHCAVCHSAKLEGQPDWQVPLASGLLPAPPHDATGHTWHHADQDLMVIVRDGMTALLPGRPSGMPPFAGVLADPEIEAVLAFIKSTWPERERDYQEVQTRQRTAEEPQ